MKVHVIGIVSNAAYDLMREANISQISQRHMIDMLSTAMARM